MPALSRTAVADISLADLPPSHETRWVMSRKAKLIEAIHAGLISLEDAATRYRLTLDELTEWQSYFARHGARGLRATFLQQYRHIRRP
ncbi:MAG: hypothetical protein RLZ07_398 [Pseudomonadota bacterium]|jgi:hypothetical protein